MTFHTGTGSLNRTCCELHPLSWRWVKILRMECLQPFAPILCDWGNQREVVWAERSQMRAFTSPTCPSTLYLPSRFLLPVVFFFSFSAGQCMTSTMASSHARSPKPPSSHARASRVSTSFSLCVSSKGLGGCVDARTIAAARRRYHMHVHKPPHACTHTITASVINKIFFLFL